MLEKALEYARNAREAVDLAGVCHEAEERRTLMHMAETWLLLAEAALGHPREFEGAGEGSASPAPEPRTV